MPRSTVSSSASSNITFSSMNRELQKFAQQVENKKKQSQQRTRQSKDAEENLEKNSQISNPSSGGSFYTNLQKRQVEMQKNRLWDPNYVRKQKEQLQMARKQQQQSSQIEKYNEQKKQIASKLEIQKIRTNSYVRPFDSNSQKSSSRLSSFTAVNKKMNKLHIEENEETKERTQNTQEKLKLSDQSYDLGFNQNQVNSERNQFGINISYVNSYDENKSQQDEIQIGPLFTNQQIQEMRMNDINQQRLREGFNIMQNNIHRIETQQQKKSQIQRITKKREGVNIFFVTQYLHLENYNLDMYDRIKRAKAYAEFLQQKFSCIKQFNGVYWLRITTNKRYMKLKLDQMKNWDTYLIYGMSSYIPVHTSFLRKVLQVSYQNLTYLSLVVQKQPIITQNHMGLFRNRGRSLDLSDLKLVQNKIKDLDLYGYELTIKMLKSLFKCKFSKVINLNLFFTKAISIKLFLFILKYAKKCIPDGKIKICCLQNFQNNNKDFQLLKKQFSNSKYHQLQNRIHICLDQLEQFSTYYRKKQREQRIPERQSINPHGENDQDNIEEEIQSNRGQDTMNMHPNEENRQIDNQILRTTIRNHEQDNLSLINLNGQISNLRYNKIKFDGKSLSSWKSQYGKNNKEQQISEEQYTAKFFSQMNLIKILTKKLSLKNNQLRRAGLGKYQFHPKTQNQMNNIIQSSLRLIEKWDRRFIISMELFYQPQKVEKLLSMQWISLLELYICGIGKKINSNQSNNIRNLNFLTQNYLNLFLQTLVFEGKQLTQAFITELLEIQFPQLKRLRFIFSDFCFNRIMIILAQNKFKKVSKKCGIIFSLKHEVIHNGNNINLLPYYQKQLSLLVQRQIFLLDNLQQQQDYFQKDSLDGQDQNIQIDELQKWDMYHPNQFLTIEQNQEEQEESDIQLD